ncbi:vitamin K epoxide reductase family protein [Pleomorphovibrio marinus]|uniref:vitamin K epoxide reductase family protein n=1 Tax=Pleomorphovibrio marinus TaxID=2164132 RepID=UPI000E0B8ACC|nr:vitamin K epoxide reductase family protein [Pleomorphovibrio marinus]
MNNCFQASKKILELLQVRFTGKFLKEEVLSHPHFPSLLTVSDVLEKYNISQVSLKIGKEKLDEVPLPCIVQVSVQGTNFFHALFHISEKTVSGYDEKGKEIKVDREAFMKSWTGVVLVVERNENSAEPGIEERVLQGKIKAFLMGGIALFAFISIGSGLIEMMGSWYWLAGFGYLVLKMAGLGVSVLILWREIDKENSLVQKFCPGGGTVDCNTVLDSTAFKFADGAISPGSLAFAYFFAGSLMLLTQIFSLSLLTTLAWLSLATFPLVVISLYYQAFKLKNWCRLCLILISLLLLEMALAWAQQLYLHPIALQQASVFAFIFIGSQLGWIYQRPILDTKEDLFTYKRNLKKLKSDRGIFQSLLSRSKKIKNSTQDLGIILKNESPRYQVIKVCNPYCGPCAKAHPELELLVEEGIIDLQILYFPNADMEDIRTKTINHFLAINSKENQQFTRKALDHWYTAEKKDYTVFAHRYPMNGELNQQQERLLAMKAWCEKEGITHTPTYFINGYELPKEYSIADIKEISAYK